MVASELQVTCLGLPLVLKRPLTEDDLVLVHSWQSKRQREAWAWGPAWIIVMLIPIGIPVMLVAGFLLSSEVFKIVVVVWATLFPLICLAGLIQECIWPIRRWTRYVIGLTALSGAFGIALNFRSHAAGDLFIWPLVLDVPVGLALFFLKVADRSKLVRPSKVDKDLLNGEVWEFSAEDSSAVQLLPVSGLILRSGDEILPSPLPISIQMAAPSPQHRWEIPAYGLSPVQDEQLLTKRRMEPMEIEEGRVLVKAHARAGIPAFLLLAILSLILGGAAVVRLKDGEAINAMLLVHLAVSGFFCCLVLAGILNRWKLIRNLKRDLSDASLVVVRSRDAPPGAIPLAEVLPISRIVWTREGRVGPLRQRYLKKFRMR